MQEDTKLVEEQMRDVAEVKTSGELAEGDVVPSEGLPFPMKVSTVIGADKVRIWDTVTGVESIALRYMLSQLLRRKRPDGSPVFTTVKPKIKVKVGSLKCMLHPSDPNRGHYDQLGLPVCSKDGLTSPHAVRQHMLHRHKVEWATIEQERIEAKEKREQELQESLIKGVKAATKRTKK